MSKPGLLQKPFFQAFLGVLSAIMFLAAAFLGGYYYHASQQNLPRLPILEEAYQILIHHSIIETPDSQTLEYAMIHGMVGAYHDPYTIFQEPVQHELSTYTLEGGYGDIGAELLKDDEGYWILFPYPGSPAEAAGIQKGDRLLAVLDFSVTPDTLLDSIKAAIYGPSDEKIKLQISQPPDYKPVWLDVGRALVPLPSVSYRIDPDEARLGILTLNLIGSQTLDELIQAIDDLQAEGATHFVLDLRHNPGGYLSSGVDITRLFLAEGEILAEKYRMGEPRIIKVEEPGRYTDIPLVILIGEDTASSAELVAGALQVNQRAILIGNHSYGKDTIQQVFVLSDESSLRLTAAHWWIPGLEATFPEHGLIPDLPAPEFIDFDQPDPGIQAVKAYFFP